MWLSILVVLLSIKVIECASSSLSNSAERKYAFGRCGGPKHFFPPVPPSLAQTGHAQPQLPAPVFVPFNILFLIDEQLTEPNRIALNGALKKVNEKFSKIIKAPKLDEVRYKNYCVGGTTCHHVCSKPIDIPAEYILPCGCNPSAPDNPSAKVKEYNAAEYTLVIYVVVKDDGADTNKRTLTGECGEKRVGGTWAMAGACEYDGTGRPNHGFIIYCDMPHQMPEEALFGVTLHETLHVIITDLIAARDPANKCPNGGGDPSLCTGLYKKIDDDQWTDLHGNSQQMSKFLVTNRFVQQAAADHFTCPSVEGAELNTRRNPNTNLVEPDFYHWSEVLFFDEILSFMFTPGEKLSNLTLSAIASAGSFYKVDFSYAEPLAISKPFPEHGCDIAKMGCHEFIRSHAAVNDKEPSKITPYCDPRMPPVQRHVVNFCSKDQTSRLMCTRETGFQLCPVTKVDSDEFKLYDHYSCPKTTYFNRDVQWNPQSFGATAGSQTTCLTVAKSVLMLAQVPVLNLCAMYECRTTNRTIVLKLQPAPGGRWPPPQPGVCDIECRADQSDKIVEFSYDTPEERRLCQQGQTSPISFICPNYYQVCEPPTTTTTTTTTATASTTSSPPTTDGEQPTTPPGPGPPPDNTPPPGGSACVVRAPITIAVVVMVAI